MKKLLGVVVAALCFGACGFAGEADPQLHLGEGRLRLVAPGGHVSWERTVEGTPTEGFVAGDCVYWRQGDAWSRVGVVGDKIEPVKAEEAEKLQKKSGAKRLPGPHPGVVAVQVPAWRWSLPFYTVPAEDEVKFREIARAVGLPRPAKPRRVLIVARALGYAHNEALSWGNRAFCVAGEETGSFVADVTNDVSVLANRSVLDRYGAVVLNNCTFVTAKANPGLADALCGYVRDGGGLCLVHSSVDSFYDAPEVQAMNGGRFCGHPWMAGGTWSFRNECPDSPLMTPFRGLGPTFRRSEEIYVQASPPFDRKACDVLISMDLNDPATKKSENSWGKEKKPLRTDGDYAVSWTKRYGGGRIFYTSFGHDKRAFFDPARFGHMLLGLHHCLSDCQ